ncbi:MAG: M23 family metallopeptidase [Muribaculaceae bacterium]|nr:M23 family metallopeptidase [Muribaculaceae bacterium]
MKISLNLFFIIVILAVSIFPLRAQDNGPRDLSLFTDLVNVVSSENKLDKTDTLPEDNTEMVLNFLTSAYIDHGYHETGYWGSNLSKYTYVPYKGKLPDYDPADFRMPVFGHLTSKYGYRSKFKRFHRGIDISLHSGDTVRCALPGVVTGRGYDTGGYGHYIVVAHSGGLETLYGHLSDGLVNPGKAVKAGEALGIGGSTGNSTGPHLHFELRYRGVAIDPASWFNLNL